MIAFRRALMGLLAFLLWVPYACAGETVLDLPIAGVTQRVMLVSPPVVRATIVMLPGGAGNIGLHPDGVLRRGGNFLVRTRALWAARGYAVVIPDAAGTDNLRGRRSTPGYADIVHGLVGFAQSRNARPVFLMGTSQGSIAAMNGAADRRNTLAGVVLTESVSRRGGSGETVFDAHPADVAVPALVVANRSDQCFVAPPADAPQIAASMTHAPEVRVLYVTGGTGRGGPCTARSPHGYDGIEADVVAAIGAWIDAHIAR